MLDANLDRKSFFGVIRKQFGALSQSQVDAINNLLDYMQRDLRIADKRHFAYMFATVKHETADTYLPIAEYGKGKGKKYGKPDPTTGHVYYGRGYVQLTWLDNYKKMSKLVNIDLVNTPELAMQPDTAYKIMSVGMTLGTFTSKKLLDYINPRQCDYRGARKIINGIDKADLIASYAKTFEEALQ